MDGAGVLVVLHPNNELRNAQHVGIHGRLPPSLSFFLALLAPLLSFYKQVHGQARSNRYYIVLRARVALADRKCEEESFYISRRPGLGAPCAIKRGERKAERASLLKCQISMSVNGYTSLEQLQRYSAVNMMKLRLSEFHRYFESNSKIGHSAKLYSQYQ